MPPLCYRTQSFQRQRILLPLAAGYKRPTERGGGSEHGERERERDPTGTGTARRWNEDYLGRISPN